MPRSYDAAFRCTAYDSVPRNGAEHLPGKEIADDLSRELTQLGVAVAEVLVEEPFWVVRAQDGVDVLVYIYLPHEDRSRATWAVSVESLERNHFGLFKRDEPPPRVALLSALDAALKRLPHVHDIRWFRGLPGDPHGLAAYRTQPVGRD